MISEKMTAALNKQINAEMYAGYLYLAISSYCSYTGLKGASKWFFVQTQEESTHALRIYNYVNRLGEHAKLASIKEPPTDFDSLQAMFEAALQHEQKVTGMINDLVNLAIEEKDHATEIFLQWFVNEQVEEEESVNDVLAQLKLAGEDKSGLFMIDKELGARVFNMPADFVETI